MNDFIKLIDEGFEVSVHKETKHGCYIFDFKKGKKRLRLIKLPDAFVNIREDLILDGLAKLARDEI